jgi:hypothetical protein
MIRPSRVDVDLPQGAPSWLLRVMVVFVLVVLFLSVWWVTNAITHPPAPKCFTDSNMANDPSLPCYEPGA